jgi:hypothetical protein
LGILNLLDESQTKRLLSILFNFMLRPADINVENEVSAFASEQGANPKTLQVCVHADLSINYGFHHCLFKGVMVSHPNMLHISRTILGHIEMCHGSSSFFQGSYQVHPIEG